MLYHSNKLPVGKVISRMTSRPLLSIFTRKVRSSMREKRNTIQTCTAQSRLCFCLLPTDTLWPLGNRVQDFKGYLLSSSCSFTRLYQIVRTYTILMLRCREHLQSCCYETLWSYAYLCWFYCFLILIIILMTGNPLLFMNLQHCSYSNIQEI